MFLSLLFHNNTNSKELHFYQVRAMEVEWEDNEETKGNLEEQRVLFAALDSF
jgi:hypothetical protein